MWRTAALASVFLQLASAAAHAQVLPPHPPLRILIVSDEVNPHGLPPEQLTQPGEIRVALLGASALNLAADANAVREIPTDQLEQATALLALPRTYDVLVYFAHRIPETGTDPGGRQAAFVAAVDAFLAAGGGVVSFHHGIYRTAGKEAMQALLHGEATGNVPYDTVNGQNVIDVAPGHFVTTNGVAYGGNVAYADAAFGVPNASYPFFNNTPDERYPSLVLLPSPGTVRPLFASNYADNGTTHILGYEQRRSTWSGVVIVYQPGEYQPNALGPGNNFQILLNAIVYAGTISGAQFANGFE